MLVRRAKAGDGEGLGELVARFTPMLLSQARFRLGSRRSAVEPEDVVQEVWVRALPALPDLGERGGRHTPVMLRFLASMLLNIVNELLRSQIRARRLGHGATRSVAGPSELPDETLGVVTRVVRSEKRDALADLVDSLDPSERELFVLRGIEGGDNKEVAALLGETPNAVSLRFNRLLKRLRGQLRGSVLDELGSD